MHNLKSIRENINLYKKKILNRGTKIDFDNLINLDVKNREIIKKKEKLEQEKKVISKTKDKSLFEKSKKISEQIEAYEQDQTIIKNKIDGILNFIPNLPLDDVPVGRDDKSNKELKIFGNIPKFSFKVRSHYELGTKMQLMDFDTATKISGSRFVFLKGKLAALERAISNFMLDIHTKEFGYEEVSPPLIATDETMFGTGQLPKFENDQFELKLEGNQKKYLIPTAEVILTNIVKDKTLTKKDIPLRLVASTACFRKEAGSYGKDTKGMLRQHQFYKVELVSIVEPNNCSKELDRMISCAEEILKRLKLPYRSVLLSTGDMGFSAQKTVDLEVWIPSENKYREISSCSSCGQFQSRRMKGKYKDEKNKSDFLGTLNGSGLAIGRTLIAIMENYQNSDGSVSIPEAIRPYMNNLDKI
ncbi:MAG: serine--tRNA ligase [Candidatus Marinimicrobia bacterium]|nr:serine--tRNA ligase [Candidatus Neomarinimicrobiota bacterium]|tara:strand:- start:6432 stop:7679 length:1248 start_codon:yes stop_codon:yes gene_type:complete